MKSNTKSPHDESPNKINKPMDVEVEFQTNDDEEFYECLDNENDIKLIEERLNINSPNDGAPPLRRATSFTNIE